MAIDSSQFVDLPSYKMLDLSILFSERLPLIYRSNQHGESQSAALISSLGDHPTSSYWM
jgi:hypothetical protein